MTLEEDDYALAARLSYEDARRYLESRGWTRVASRRNDLGIFRLGEHEAVLPMDPTLADYAGAMVFFARRVGEAEGKSTRRVLVDLSAANKDRHRPALILTSDSTGVSLDTATQMLAGQSRALMAAACSVLQPRHFHPRMALGDAEAFIADTRLLTTEVGSFVLVIDTPTEVEGTRPGFGREASVLLMRSLAHLAGAIRRGTPDRIVNPEGDEPQVSANLCEAVLQMVPPSEAADLRFGVSWSPLIAPPAIVPDVITLDRHMYETIEKLAGQMRPSESTAPKTHYGFVKELKVPAGRITQVAGEVIFRLVSEEGIEMRAKAQLDADAYLVAIGAHALWRPVWVQGELHRVRRGYELRNVTGIGEWDPKKDS